jgi:hypothetical protein
MAIDLDAERRKRSGEVTPRQVLEVALADVDRMASVLVIAETAPGANGLQGFYFNTTSDYLTKQLGLLLMAALRCYQERIGDYIGDDIA